MKSLTKYVLAACVAATLVPIAALAQNTSNEAYWVDSGKQVVKNPFGLCWRAGYWTPAMANLECDPDLVKKPEQLPQQAMATPAPAEPEPAPAPVYVPPPSKKFSFSADALFDFNKAVLKPQGKVMLDGLATELSTAHYEIIDTVGHADRIGSPAYNQKLSERRASAVKAYLVSKNIPAERIKVSGKGEAEPVTKPDDCTGPKSKKLIACLQPDRRVDVEVK